MPGVLTSLSCHTCSNHVLPDDQRMTPAKKMYMILNLIQETYKTKMAYNKQFLALREKKRTAVVEIRKRNARLKEIGVKLNEMVSSAR